MKSPSDKPKKSPVKIRYKELADGCKSIYLDIYFKGKRKYEFLKLYIHPGKDEDTVLANAEALRMAEEARLDRLARLSEPEAEPQPEAAPVTQGTENSPVPDEKIVKARARAKRTSREPVTVRLKKLKDGRDSVYLDIYYKGKREYEFLKMYCVPGEKEANEIVMKRAEELRRERMEKLLKEADTSSEGKTEAMPEKKKKLRFQVLLAFRMLRNGDKSYYLYIRYGDNWEHRCSETLGLYVPADASEAEEKRVKAKARAIQREREDELRKGTFFQRPSMRRTMDHHDEVDHYKEYKAKRRAQTEISAVSSELKRNTRSKEPVRIRFKELANGSRSIYLAINVNGKRSYDYLKLYLVPETDQASRMQNKQTMEAAYAIKAQRIIQITNGAAGIKKDVRLKMRLVDWMATYRDRQIGKGKMGTKEWVDCVISVLDRYPVGRTATLADIDRQWLTDFMLYLMNDYITYKGTHPTKSTVDTYLRALKAAFNMAVEEEILQLNPMMFLDRSHLKGTPNVREFLTVEEVRKLIDTPCRRDDIKRAFLFSCFCGLRISDVRGLKWGNVAVEGGKLWLKITQFKTKRPLSIPLNQQALRWMPERGESTDDDFIFPPLPVNMKVLEQWAKAAGIKKHVTYHVSRHTFATMELTMGADLYTTSKLLGHTNVATTQIYAKIVNSKKEEAVSLLDGAFE